MRGLLFLLYSFFGLLLLAAGCLLLLRIPAKLQFRLQTDVFSGAGWLIVRHPLVIRSCRVRFSILDAPCLRVDLLRRDGTVKQLYNAEKAHAPSNGLPPGLLESIEILAFDATYFAGVDGAPVATALLCGALSAVTGLALPLLFSKLHTARASVSAVPLWDCCTFRINLEGIAKASPAQIIRVILRDKKEKLT